MTISIIVARARNGVIGNRNSLPWDIPEDMAYFKAVTTGKPIIMGKKTFESIGKALPGRKNIVLTRSGELSTEGCFTAETMDEAIMLAEGAEEIMVIGGASVYTQFLPLAQRVYLTAIDQDFIGDAFFPQLSHNEWREVSRREGRGAVPFKYSFVVFERIKK